MLYNHVGIRVSFIDDRGNGKPVSAVYWGVLCNHYCVTDYRIDRTGIASHAVYITIFELSVDGPGFIHKLSGALSVSRLFIRIKHGVSVNITANTAVIIAEIIMIFLLCHTNNPPRIVILPTQKLISIHRKL